MMMKWRHLEDTLFAQLVTANLQDDADGLKNEDAADEGEQQFLFDNNRNSPDGAAQCQRAYIAHKDFRWVSVVPKEANAGADHGAAKDCDLADHRHALKLEVIGKDCVAADVSKDRKRGGGDDGAADGQSVET